MTTTKHTPGPWDIESNGPTSLGGKDVVIVDGGKILTFGMDGEEGIYAFNEADILLMNAAPDLLAACESVRDDIAERARDAVVDEDEVREAYEKKIRDLDAAIAKAKGEAP